MDRRKYDQDMKRCETLGTLIRTRIRYLGLSLNDLSDFIQPFVKVNAREIVGNLCSKSSSVTKLSSGSNSGDHIRHLERLSLIYFVLFVSEDDPMISLTGKINPNFVYPPDLDHYTF